MQIETKNVQDIIHDNMMSYSNYVITNRALPDVRDGMKPVYRRILITMNMMKIGNLTKSANVEGEVMKIHPHGTTYPTIVGMVQKDNNITPLIAGKGNFGRHTSRDLQAAAQRYTEIKLSDLSKDIFKDIDKQMVNFIPNYDGSIMIPEVLPVKSPLVLHYAQEGIAVGMSSRLPSFNLIDINEATKKFILTDKHTILVPDFATGGEIIENEDVFREINTTGLGTVRLRAKVEIKDNTILVKEIPYSTTREAIIEAIIKLIKTKKISEITNVEDATGLAGMGIEITAKRNTDMEMLLHKLYRWTPMENTYSSRMNMLVNGLPRIIGVHEVIEIWVKWRRESIRKGIRYELQKMNEKFHVLLGLQKILLDIDKAVQIIRFSKENEIDEKLMVEFQIDELQAEYISNIKLRNLNEDVILRRTKELESIQNEILEKEKTLNDNSKINQIIIKDLDEISEKYGEPRRTQIVRPSENVIIVDTITEVAETPDTNIQTDTSTDEYKIIITKDGYLKKVSMDCMQNRIKDGDEIIHQFVVTNKSEILVFSGTDAYKLYVDTLPVSNEAELGMYLPTHLNVENICGYAMIDDTTQFVLVVYDNMKVAKIDARSYRTSSRRTKLENSIFPNAKPVQIVTLFEDVDLELHWKNKTQLYNTVNMKAKASRNTQGVTIRNEKIVIK